MESLQDLATRVCARPGLACATALRNDELLAACAADALPPEVGDMIAEWALCGICDTDTLDAARAHCGADPVGTVLAACERGHADVAAHVYARHGLVPAQLLVCDPSCFHAACEGGHLRAVRWLASLGGAIPEDLHARETAFHAACVSGNAELVTWLYESGVFRESLGVRAALLRECFGRRVYMARALYALGAPLHGFRGLVPSLIVRACGDGRLDMARWLHSLDVTLDELRAINALLDVVVHYSIEAARWMFSLGFTLADLNKSDYYVLTTLCMFNELEKARWVVSLGITVENAREPLIRSLQYACMCGHLELARWIVSLGLTLEDVCADAYTAFAWACSNGHTHIAEWIVSLGFSHEDLALCYEETYHLSQVTGQVQTLRWLRDLKAR